MSVLHSHDRRSLLCLRKLAQTPWPWVSVTMSERDQPTEPHTRRHCVIPRTGAAANLTPDLLTRRVWFLPLTFFVRSVLSSDWFPLDPLIDVEVPGQIHKIPSTQQYFFCYYTLFPEVPAFSFHSFGLKSGFLTWQIKVYIRLIHFHTD